VIDANSTDSKAPSGGICVSLCLSCLLRPVHSLNFLEVHIADHLALELQGGGQLAALDAERARQQGEPAHLLYLGKLRIDALIDLRLNRLDNSWVSVQLRALDAVRFGEALGLFRIERQQRAQVFATLADQHCIADQIDIL